MNDFVEKLKYLSMYGLTAEEAIIVRRILFFVVLERAWSLCGAEGHHVEKALKYGDAGFKALMRWLACNNVGQLIGVCDIYEIIKDYELEIALDTKPAKKGSAD